jgi:IclR family acetate operon transcriptional repressor
MLVYRDFAVRNPDRSYGAGPALQLVAPTDAPISLLREVALPHLHDLVERVRESANLVVMAGTEVRFIATVECDQVLRVGDRAGRRLPAHLTSGGKAILAGLPRSTVDELYADDPDIDLPRLRRTLTLVRQRGFAINDQQTETGLTALGMVFAHGTGVPKAAACLALPTARFNRDRLPGLIAALTAAVQRIEHDLTKTT